MPAIMLEGRRVINNITRAASLFLMKTLFSFCLSVLMLFFPGSYPFQPIQMTLVSALMVGIPGFFLALEPNNERIHGNFLRTVLGNAIPGGAAVTVCAAAAMILTAFGWDHAVCSTIATVVAGTVGFTVLTITCLPLNRMRSIMLALIAAAFAFICVTFRQIFFLEPLSGKEWIALIILAAVGSAIVIVLTRLIRSRRSGAKA